MKIRAFTKTYPGFKLDMPEIELAPGRVYAMVGGNGCGKSTYAKTVAGIISPDAGGSLTDASAGYMSQSSFAFRMSVRKNVLLNTDDESLADEMISRLGLGEQKDANAKNLSGGQKARMALARVMVKPYELLILDEPTASMDVKNSLISEELIREYAEKGPAVLLITHSLQQAKRTADEVIFLENGHLIEKGKCAKVLNDPDDPRTKAFIDFYGVMK